MGLGQAAAELRGRVSPLLLTLTVLVVSAAGTAVARAYALRRRLVDEPGARRSHSIATPRGGGAGPGVAIAIAILMTAERSEFASVVLSLAGFLAVAAIGAWDDHRPLSASLRLIVHVGAGVLLAFVTFEPSTQPMLFLAVIAMAVVLINVWNFMDGIDGIAASQAAIVAVAAAALGDAPLALAVAAACIGFLPFNFPRARIFMGDVGSGALGFVMAMLAARAAARAPSDGLRLLFPLSPFLVDAGMTLLRRMVRRERWWEAHTQHLYQALARRYGHVRVTSGYIAAAVVASVIAISMPSDRPGVTMASLGVWYTGAAVLWLIAQRGPHAAAKD